MLSELWSLWKNWICTHFGLKCCLSVRTLSVCWEKAVRVGLPCRSAVAGQGGVLCAVHRGLLVFFCVRERGSSERTQNQVPLQQKIHGCLRCCAAYFGAGTEGVRVKVALCAFCSAVNAAFFRTRYIFACEHLLCCAACGGSGVYLLSVFWNECWKTKGAHLIANDTPGQLHPHLPREWFLFHIILVASLCRPRRHRSRRGLF